MKNLKDKLLNKETIMYLVFGVLTTVVDLAIYLICITLSINFILANIFAWCGAVLFAYITNKLFVFENRNYDPKLVLNELTTFVSARLFSLVFSIVFIYTAVSLLGTDKLVAKIISAIFVVIINYFLSKIYVFNTDKNKQRGLLSFCKDNIAYIIAFLIPLCILIVVYYIRKIYPFGDNMYLRSDCYHQYAPFTKELFNKLKEGGNLTYSWNIGLGVNFSALYSYYLASPVNWFIGLISPNHIIEVMNLFIIVKTALCSFTFAYYISKKFNNKKALVASLGVFYALSSYFAAFSWNLMWLDCLVLLPLIILGLERLVKENKCYLYCITLGLAILSNYYIAIMICIYCVLYFFALMYMDETKKTLSYYFAKFKNFAIYSIIAGGFAAISILPAYAALSSTASGDFEFPKTIVNYFSVFDMLSRSMINVDPAIFSAHDPNIYCTILVFLLIPLYFINPKIKFKEKIAKITLIVIFLVSFNTNIPNYIWHGFHFPNSLPCRESFIYIFLLLTMCYESLSLIKEITTKQLAYVFSIAVVLFLAFEKLCVNDEYSYMIIYVSMTFLLFYLIVIALLRSNSYKRNFVVYLLFVITTAEAFINTEETSLSTSTRSAYLNDNKSITQVLETAKENDDSFYRTEKYDRRTKNDAAWNDYYGASTFSSTANSGLSDYYGALGFEKSTNAYAYYGHTPLTESMFSIKYVISNTLLEDNELIKLNNQSTGKYLYENLYTLPLGFMLPKNLEENWDLKNSNPFEVQNYFCGYVNNTEDMLFTRLGVNTLGTDNIVSADNDMHLFIYVTSSLEKVIVTTTKENGDISTKTITSMKHRHILDLGKIEKGTTVSIKSDDKEVDTIQLYAYSFNIDVFKKTYNNLNKNPLVLTKFSDTNLTGTVTADTDGMLYTSIPYDKGWTVYVDGKKAKTHAFENALLAIDLYSGEHDIEFVYTPVGYTSGLAITFLSIIAFVLIIVTDILKKRKDSKKIISHNNN